MPPTKAVRQILYEQTPEAVAERSRIAAQIRAENAERHRKFAMPATNTHVYQPVKMGRIH